MLEPKAVAFYDLTFRNGILSRLHKTYVLRYIIAHYFSGVFN